MKTTLPLRLWIKQCFLFSAVAGILVMMASLIEGTPYENAIWKFVVTALAIFLTCLANLCILTGTGTVDPLKSSPLTKLLTLLASMLILYLLGLVFHYFNPDLSLTAFKKAITDLNGGLLLIYLFLQAMLLNFVVMPYLYLLMTMHSKVQFELERSQMAKAKSEAANHLLRQQIQPHFLFNALNTLKALIRKDRKLAESYLIKLSDFLRVSISVNKEIFSSLAQEIKLCEDYLDMQKMRFNEALCYYIELDMVQEQGLLPIFSLQPLIENAIKHNQFTKEFPLNIHVFQENGWVVVQNNRSPKLSSDISTGSGLLNLNERYKMLSGNEIEILQQDELFIVKIKVLQHEHTYHRG